MAMEDANAPGMRSDECREPTLEDLIKLCRALNDCGARYLVVGGFAIRAAGYSRNTMDIDLLVETGLENETRLIQALLVLPDQAIRQIKPGEVEQFTVVRVADEVLVDLMKSGCGVDYAEAIQDAVYRVIEGVRIPFASPKTLWRMKQTRRERDIPDRLFLRMLLESQGHTVEPAPAEREPSETLWRCIKKFFGKTGDP
jgi:hypothetical protein